MAKRPKGKRPRSSYSSPSTDEAVIQLATLKRAKRLQRAIAGEARALRGLIARAEAARLDVARSLCRGTGFDVYGSADVTAAFRSLDNARLENDALLRTIRELEKARELTPAS